MRKLLVALLVLSGCTPSPAERRAVTVAECIAGVASSLPPDDLLPKKLDEYTSEDVVFAAHVVTQIRACTRAGADAGL